MSYIEKYPLVHVPDTSLHAVREILGINLALCGLREARIIVYQGKEMQGLVIDEAELVDQRVQETSIRLVEEKGLEQDLVEIMDAPSEVLVVLRAALWAKVDPTLVLAA